MGKRGSAPARGRDPKGLSQGNNGVAYTSHRRSLQEAKSFELKRQRRMRHAKIVHGLGWRVTFEGFDQLAREMGEGTVDKTLERLANIDPELLKLFRVDDLPLSPIRVVPK
jgi:hypothetical protein